MASRETIKQIIARIKTLYFFEYKNTDIKTLADVWEETLEEYTDAETAAGFKEALKTCSMPPKPADVIKRIEEIRESQNASAAELWDVLKKAVRRANDYVYRYGQSAIEADGKTSGQHAREAVKRIFENLPSEIKCYLNSVNTLEDMARSYDSEAMRFEKKNFENRLPTIRKREELRKQLAITGLAQGLLKRA